MGEKCEILLSKEEYSPGETVEGRVECDFDDETKVRAIRIKIRGRAKAYWKEGHTNVYCAEEVYIQDESDLISGETTFVAGLYSYPFKFTLPQHLPSSMFEDHGNVKYSVQATVDRPWAFDYESKKVFKVYSYYDPKTIEDFKKPVEVTEEKTPFQLLDESGPIIIQANLPVKGYLPSQIIKFHIKVKNNSKINVDKIIFKAVQGFEFHIKENVKTMEACVGDELTVENSLVEPQCECSWNLEIKLPPDMFNGNLDACNVIKIFWELQGEVHLPFPYTNFMIRVPFIVGAAPLGQNSA
ncbi:hypothetical protein ILUMI_07134 [Ignelater luminosus]|uniref:Arrestin C-terminal-like domain-containing protein n=1 Tax=Ignelater luminosus TaxID=2038154 RepID=A0A8K0D8N5_IGNLU|nr:hypothetical protein ILUMI_07134 [Ignelater luminosus]